MSDKQRILIVDDERQITRVLSRGLTAKGYDVHVAADGEAALQTFGDWHPDLIITDLSMPNMNGLELCRRLRAFSEVPIIVLSVKGEERAKVEALDAGADDMLPSRLELMSCSRAYAQRCAAPRREKLAARTFWKPATFACSSMSASLLSSRKKSASRQKNMTL